jgi:phosphatidylglycerol---prolipoprotein diacylglyceryl transferase
VPTFTWNIDPVAIHIGSFPIRYYSLIFVGVFLGGYALLNWQVRRGRGGEEVAGDFIVYGVLGVLVGSRLGHVLFYDLKKAVDDPLWVLEIWTGGLASHGAVLGLIFAMWLFTRRRRIPFLEGADRFSFSAALGATLVRIGNFFNSEIVGRKTDGTWGVRFPRFDGQSDPPLRHPSQLYEAALGIAILLLLLLADRMWGKEKRPRGALISLFFVLYFTGRFFVEFVKQHQVMPDSALLDMGQYLSIPGFLLGVYGLVWSFKKRQPVGWEADDDDADDEDDEDDEELNAPSDDDEDDDDKPAKRRDDEDDDDEPADPDDGDKKLEAKKPSAGSLTHDPDVDDEFGDDDEDDAKEPAAAKKKPSGESK